MAPRTLPWTCGPELGASKIKPGGRFGKLGGHCPIRKLSTNLVMTCLWRLRNLRLLSLHTMYSIEGLLLRFGAMVNATRSASRLL